MTARLSDVEREALNVAIDEAETCKCCGYDYGSKHVYAAVESILAARLAEAEQAAEQRGAERVLVAVEALAGCHGGPRHWYAVDATCQRCEMPSWVEANLRALVAQQRDGGGSE